jgi:GrpB-like predicted nucleotidyltransferase (UPF0157 family)
MPMTIEPYTSRPAEYCDYDPQAPLVANVLIALIQANAPNVRVEHVGSSAVPGCGGKGYIDLLVQYPDGELDVAKRALAELG